MPKVSNNFGVWKPFIIFSLIFWLIASVYLFLFYNWEQARLYGAIIADSEYGYGIIHAQKIFTSDDGAKFSRNDLAISMKPGDSFTGKLAVKNNDNTYDFEMLTEDFEEQVNNGEPQKSKFQPIIQFKPRKFLLDKDKFKFIEYTLSIPKDFPLGSYQGVLKTYPPDKFRNLKDPKSGVTILLMVGVKVSLEVSENPKTYKYVDYISDPIQVTKINVFNRFRIILILFFVSLSLTFILHARRFSN